MPETETDASPSASTPNQGSSAALPAQPTGGNALLYICENLQVSRREVMPILRRAGYEVDMVEAHMRSVHEIHRKPYRTVMIDIAARDGTGFAICQSVRATSCLPIMLILRGAGREGVLRGFEMGADTYMLSPLDPREFMARLRALTRPFLHLSRLT